MRALPNPFRALLSLFLFCPASPLLHSTASALEFRTIEQAGQRFTVCQVDIARDRLQLFHRDEKQLPFKRFDRLAAWLAQPPRSEKLIFAMNAGMYHPDFSAVGLFVANGQELAPLNTDDAPGNFFLKPNGVFLVTAKGAQIVETSEYPALREPVLLATQSGPLLLHRGRMHPKFQEGAPSKLLRNGVGVPSPGIALFVLAETPINFHDFATFFRDTLKCPDALFFDGTVSSLYAPALHRHDFRIDLGPIIGVTE